MADNNELLALEDLCTNYVHLIVSVSLNNTKVKSFAILSWT